MRPALHPDQGGTPDVASEPRPRRRGLGGALAVAGRSVLAGVLAGVAGRAGAPTDGGAASRARRPRPDADLAHPPLRPYAPSRPSDPLGARTSWSSRSSGAESGSSTWAGPTPASRPSRSPRQPGRELPGAVGGPPDDDLHPHREPRPYAAGRRGRRERRPALFDEVPAVCAGRITRPAWHPTDPTLLAVPCIDGAGAYGLHLMRTDGTLVRTLELGGKKIGDATWNGDGTRLAFWSGEPDSGLDGGAIFVADGSGANPLQVTDGRPGQDADPAWNPAGDVLVFRRQISDTVSDLYTVPGEGRTARSPCSSTKTAKSDPSWSPSGDQIAFNSDSAFRDHGRVTRVWLMNIDGSSPLPLWRNPPRWAGSRAPRPGRAAEVVGALGSAGDVLAGEPGPGGQPEDAGVDGGGQQAPLTGRPGRSGRAAGRRTRSTSGSAATGAARPAGGSSRGRTSSR